jgi:two-component system, cell cycle sensor histidine kinase and response regulator CckA
MKCEETEVVVKKDQAGNSLHSETFTADPLNLKALAEGRKCSTGSRRILIMDDDEVVKMVLEQLLKKAGYDTTCTESGEDAIEIYKNSYTFDPFSLVIIDLTIHTGLGGKETVKILKEFDPKAKAVVFSGYSQDPIISDYAMYGFDGVLSKPFTSRELNYMLKSIFEPAPGNAE